MHTHGVGMQNVPFPGHRRQVPVWTEEQKMGQITVLGICIKQLGTTSAGVAELVGHSLELQRPLRTVWKESAANKASKEEREPRHGGQV